MKVLNLTPHSVEFYGVQQFINLEKLNPTTYIADRVEGEAVAEYESVGILRIATSTTVLDPIIEGILAVETYYGDVTGIPDGIEYDDVLIVSLPALSMAKAAGHPLAVQMVCPYGVVRQRANTSTVLGAMGVSK